MNDLIDRQAAIDAIKEFYRGAKEWKDEQEERSNIWHRADSAIASALEIGLRIKKIPSVRQWIPCSERLPKNRQYVLVTYQYEYGLIGHGITWYGEAEKKWNTSRKVTAWIPLPEPYKGEQE